MKWFKLNTLIATLGAVVLPLGALAYLASTPGQGSTAKALLQVAVAVIGLGLFALLLARLLEQVNARRVGRWLETPEGRDWLASLSPEDREAFEERFDDFR